MPFCRSISTNAVFWGSRFNVALMRSLHFSNARNPSCFLHYNTRVPSHSSNLVRRAPQQDRSTRRVAAFLEAAEVLFADLGFEAATMTAIAERSGSSIGALYSYFPDKKAIALALLDTYAGQIREHWRPLFDQI